MMIAADSREIPLADKCVHCVLTSPPYWGLRDYGLPGQLGLERTPQLYLAEMRKVFREVWRVLRDDGTAWVNLGDSYANDGKWGGETGGLQAYLDDNNRKRVGREKRETGLKPKDLCGIPWRLAFALQEDGWYLRQWIPWIKRNSMPESVTDRPGTSCEIIFLLSKDQRYFYDAEAVKMPAAGTAHDRGTGVNPKAVEHNATRIERAREGQKSAPTLERNGIRPRQNDSFSAAVRHLVPTRGRRNHDWFMDSWQGLITGDDGEPLALVVNPFPYKGAHFATFPEKLVEPCIRAGTSERGVCCQCGAPWERVIRNTVHPSSAGRAHIAGGENGNGWEGVPRATIESQTLGWRPTCLCPNQHGKTKRAIVLDPFGGSGTVGRVAIRLRRESILLDIGYRDKYAPLAVERNSRVQMELI